MIYKHIIKPLLFLMQPEKAHHFVFGAIRMLFSIPFAKFISERIFVLRNNKLERKLFGLTFSNPVGLAAGLDKDAVLFNELASLGFGFVEIGTVTPLPQPGNEKPRMFRLPADNALINRMGFNNKGVQHAVEKLRNRKSNVLIGGNIGKNKSTPNENAATDYLICFEALFDYVDYFVVNVSSPNTPGLRALQDKEPLTNLLKQLQYANSKKPIGKIGKAGKPILLKIAPDLIESQLDEIIEIIFETKLDGIVATNTTISREGLLTPEVEISKIGNGGLSGRPLSKKSTEVIRYIHKKSNGAFPIIGVGGIHSAEDALEKINAGAALVQIYTGFIYGGPALVNEINKALLKM